MRDRCNNPKNKAYGYYGGRGIQVCERWLDFDTFAADFVVLPGDGPELDRRDVNGHYSPENCRKVTRTENQRNQRRSHNVAWQGRTQHYIAWAEELGIPQETLRSRLYRRGWSLERAMTEPVNG